MRRWRDLSPLWPRIEAVAAQRKAEMERWTHYRPWNPATQVLGVCGEAVYAIETWQRPSWRSLGGHGDGGIDFPDGVNVKAVPQSDDREPTLMLLVDSGAKAPLAGYALTVIDLGGKRGRLVEGIVTRERLERAPVRDMGYGPTWCLVASEIEKEAWVPTW